MGRLTHIDEHGAAHMVDVSDKSVTEREARAEATVVMEAATLDEIRAGGMPKGDVLAVARVAGIQAAKRTSDLIPLCHPLPLSSVSVDFEPSGTDRLRISTSAKVLGRTGVEMEALTAATVAALTVYDMCKAIDRGMRIERVELVGKSGGRSGTWER